MQIRFEKYQGTGNDFVMIDNRKSLFDALSQEDIQRLCDRKFGVGADGLILIEKSTKADFYVNYFNADGSKSFCGNGSRCAVHFAHKLGQVGQGCTFDSIDGVHSGEVLEGKIAISMQDVPDVERGADYFFIDTGSPHYIKYTDALDAIEIKPAAHAIRYNDRFKSEGTNVNFVEVKNGNLAVRTYERGVEGETLSCGTGVTAVALSWFLQLTQPGPYVVETKGGALAVDFVYEEKVGFHNIKLIGPATPVFQGLIDL